jgi:hypothetical protein
MWSKYPFLFGPLPLAVIGVSYAGAAPSNLFTAPEKYAPPPPLAAWTFRSSADLAGWAEGNSGITHLEIKNNRLTGASESAGATLLSPPFSFTPSAQQIVELKLRLDHDSDIEVSGADSSPASPPSNPVGEGYPVKVARDRKLRTVHFAPFWQGRRGLKRFQIRFQSPVKFEIESAEVVDLEELPEPGTEKPDEDVPQAPGAKPWSPDPPTPQAGPVWNFAKNAEGWSAATGVDDLEQWLGVLLVDTPKNREGVVLSPPVHENAEAFPWVSLRIKSPLKPKEQKSLRFLWARTDQPGYATTEVSLKPGETFRIYNLPLSENPDWKGALAAVGCVVPPNSVIEVDYVRLLKQPEHEEAPTEDQPQRGETPKIYRPGEDH